MKAPLVSPGHNGHKEGRTRILQLFSRYREFGGEEGSVYRIGDTLYGEFDVGYLMASSSEAFSGVFLEKGVAAAKAFCNWSVVRKLRRVQEMGKYEYWLIHNVFPAMSPAVYRLAFELGVPVIQYLHNYRFGCVNGFFLNHGQPCQRCMHGNFFPAFQTACWHESRLHSGVMGMITVHARRMGLFEKIHHWVAISEAQKTEHVAMGVPADRITVVPHFYEPPSDPLPYPARGDALFVGRLSMEKGVDRLLDAWESLDECGRTLWIVGDGSERSRLEATVRSKGLRNVSFTGFLEHSEMREIWRKTAFTVVPSIWKEPFGMVVLESWAQERPVVAHRIGGLTELLTDSGGGLLADPCSPGHLAGLMREMLMEPERAAAMGRAGRDHLRVRHSKEVWIKAIRPVFSSNPQSRSMIDAGKPLLHPK